MKSVEIGLLSRDRLGWIPQSINPLSKYPGSLNHILEKGKSRWKPTLSYTISKTKLKTPEFIKLELDISPEDQPFDKRKPSKDNPFEVKKIEDDEDMNQISQVYSEMSMVRPFLNNDIMFR